MPLQGQEMLFSILEKALGADKASACLPSFSLPASVSVRFNPAKTASPEEDFPQFEMKGVSSWCKWGRDLASRPVFTLDPLFHAGCYYVQDSSAMFPGMVFRSELAEFHAESLGRPLRVLDLCAAPGGKSTDLASSLRESLGDNFILVSNEVMKARASVLADNMALWGDPNVVVTSCDPAAFAALEGFFDIILADVPCSGEGMFRKDARAREDWSPELVGLCAARQKRILADVWPALRDGGVLVYSTCTFERAENDDMVSWMSKDLGAEPLHGTKGEKTLEGNGLYTTDYGYLLVPGLVGSGEGQFCSAVMKNHCGHAWRKSMKPMKGDDSVKDAKGYLLSDTVAVKSGDTVICIPSAISPETSALSCLRPLRRGVAVGTVKGRDLVPSEDLVLSLSFNRESMPIAALDRETALRYLRRDPIALGNSPRGFVALSFCGHPFGVVKNLGNRVNSLHPISRRILMQIG